MKKFGWVLLTGMFLVTACKKEYLKPTEVYKNKDLKIEFKDFSDSRCPYNVECITSGEAIVYLEAESGGEKVDFSLVGQGSDTILFGYRIEFVDLLPYPGSGEDVSFKDKKLKLNVTKQ